MASSPKKRSMSRRSNSGRFFFGCFAPGVAGADRDRSLVRSRSIPLKGSDTKRSVLAYIAFDDEGNKVDVLQRIVPHRGEREGEVAIRPLKGEASNRLARATKAAFLDMSLVRQVRKKKPEEPTGQPRKKADQIPRLTSEEHGKSDFDASSSSRFSVAATSLSLSSMGSTPLLSPGSSSDSLGHGVSKFPSRRDSSDRPEVPVRKFSHSADPSLCLVLLPLAVLIFWGKFFAILCTSACLVFYFPSWASTVTASSDRHSVGSADHKKRVVMEGLLRRHQHPRGLQRWSSS